MVLKVCGERRAGLVDALSEVSQLSSDQHAKMEKCCANQRYMLYDTILYGQWHGPLEIFAPVFYKDALQYTTKLLRYLSRHPKCLFCLEFSVKWPVVSLSRPLKLIGNFFGPFAYLD